MSFPKFSYRGYEGSAEFSKEDGCFFGKILAIPDLVLYESESLETLEKSFQDAVNDYVDNATLESRVAHAPCSGTFNVRVGAELHAELIRISHSRNRSLNSLVKEACLELVEKERGENRTLFHYHNISITNDVANLSASYRPALRTANEFTFHS